MSLAKQISAIHLENAKFTNGDEATGTRYTIAIQDYDIDIDPEFYTGSAFDKALSGKLRHNLRGFRPTVTITYNQSTESTAWRNLYNDIITALVTNNEESITLYPDAAQTDNYEVVLDAGSYGTRYSNTVGTFEPSITLIALNEITTIPAYLEGP